MLVSNCFDGCIFITISGRSVETQRATKSAEEIRKGFKDDVAFELRVARWTISREDIQGRKKSKSKERYRGVREQGIFPKLQMVLYL